MRLGEVPEPDLGARMDRISLKFCDPGIEAGFLIANSEKLLTNLFYCSAIVTFLSAAGVAVHGLFSGGTDHELRNLHLISACGYGIGATVGVLTLIITRVSWINAHIPLVFREVFASTAVHIGMVIVVVIDGRFKVVVMGYHYEDFDGPFVDTQCLLLLAIFITGSHLALPIRWFHLVPIEASGVLLYSLLLLVRGSSEALANICFNVGALAFLTYLNMLGKRTWERTERRVHVALLAEKSLRFEAEFRLAQFAGESTNNDHLEGQGSVAQHSLPSTTETGRAFADFSTDAGVDDISAEASQGGTSAFLEKIVAIGEREQWIIQTRELELMPRNVLGAGSFGVVVAGSYTGIPVAIKVPRVVYNAQNKSHFLQLCNELRILRRLRHPNIVFLYGAYLDVRHSDIALVLERVDGMTLWRFVRAGQKDEHMRAYILQDISCALRYLHTRQPRHVHGDLKDSNVFVECGRAEPRSVRAKLLDFGLARQITRHAKPLGGTLQWMAPEVFLRGGKAIDTSSDVFSFGRLVFFVVAGIAPFSRMARKEVKRHMKRATMPELQWPEVTGGLVERCRPLVEQCTQVDPALRPNMPRVHKVIMAQAGAIAGACSDLPGFAGGDADRDEEPNLRETFKALRRYVAGGSGDRTRPGGGASVPGAGPAASGQGAVTGQLANPFAASSHFRFPRGITRPQTGQRQPSAASRESPATEQHRKPANGSPNSGDLAACCHMGRSSSMPLEPMPEADTSVRCQVWFPNFKLTPVATRLTMAHEMLTHCNVERPAESCCFMHAAVRSLIIICEEYIEKGNCWNCLVQSSIRGQCQQCGCLVYAEDLSSEKDTCFCLFCNESLDVCSAQAEAGQKLQL